MLFRNTTKGFTLIEMIVVLAVFSVMGVIASQLVSRVLKNSELMQVRGDRLIQVQRSMEIIQRDILQINQRSIRDPLGDRRDPMIIGAQALIEFTRNGWRNPLGSKRSTLQRVAYVVDGDTLYRTYWNVLDQAQDSVPAVQTLLTEVTEVEFFALDASGNEHPFWPVAGVGSGGVTGAPVDPTRRLVAVVMRLEMEPFGIVERLWPVPAV